MPSTSTVGEPWNLSSSARSKPRTLVIASARIPNLETGKVTDNMTVIIRDGRILRDCPSSELTASAYSVSGPAGLVDSYLEGKHVLTANTLGGLKTACVQGQSEALPEGLEFSRVNLQDYFISLMEEEDRK